MRLTNRWVGIVVFILGTILALLSLQLPITHKNSFGPGFLPLIVGIFIGVAGIILVTKRNHGNEQNPDWPVDKRLFRLLVIVGSLVVYTFLMDIFGFLISTALFLIGLIRFWSGYSWIFVLILGIVLTGCIYGVFIVWLNVPLPTGLL